MGLEREAQERSVLCRSTSSPLFETIRKAEAQGTVSFREVFLR